MRIDFTVPFRRVLMPPIRLVEPVPEPQGRAPRIARLLALAHKLDAMVRSGEIRDYAQCGSKTDKILDLLKRPGGVTLKELAKLTGWQPNSVRGFLSGAIGRKMGTPVESFKSSGGDRSYRLPGK